MSTVQSQDERRRFSRVSFHRPARLTVGSGDATVGVLDLSFKGALLEVPPGLAAERGQPCSLMIRLDAEEAVIHVTGQVAHRRGNRLGIKCTSIDLDSIGHLRRVVELNLGDEELLERELEALLARDG